jgi:Predicted metal-dependent hydrolase
MTERIIDLSMEIYDGAPTMPMDPKCSVSEHCNLDTLGYNLARVTISTHQGTHLDAPFHFFQDGITVDRLDISKCMGKAFKVDLTYKKPKEPIDVKDFFQYEDKVCAGANILLHTGWDKVFPDIAYFTDFPYIAKELADWFSERKINLIGMDMPTPNGTDWKYIHERMLSCGMVIVEGLANMEKIKKNEFTFISLPLRIRGRDGSPVRAVAIE